MLNSLTNETAQCTIEAIKNGFFEIAYETQGALIAPHVLVKPTLKPDGDMWCALYGENLQEGVAGFGRTPEEAMAEFDKAWQTSVTPGGARIAREALTQQPADGGEGGGQ